MIFDRLLMGDYLFWIYTTHRPCPMIIYSHITSRRGRPRHLVVVGWEEEGVLLVSQFVGLWRELGCHLGVWLNILGLPMVSMSMFRAVVWSTPCLSKVCSLVVGIRPDLLGRRVLEQGHIMSFRCLQRCLHCRWYRSVYVCVGQDPDCSNH